MKKNDYKEMISKLPYPIGSFFSYVPFRFKLGKDYHLTKQKIENYKHDNVEQNKKEIFHKTKKLVEYAINNNQFYKEFYSKKNFSLDKLQCFDDIKLIPIVTKKDLQSYDLNQRSNPDKGAMLINTGGTSGTPLAFYLDKNAFAREWSHMHEIWGELNYKPSDLKLTIRGKNLGDSLLKYNPVHNEYIINSYAEPHLVFKELRELLKKRKFYYIHGYPSAIANIAGLLNVSENLDILNKLKSSLRGVFLGSEYPAPIYRKKIQDTFNVPIISWYGHSEMAILAFEKNQIFEYEPFQTYGYTEAVLNENNQYRLIGTSYYNYNSPFIRYDTGDLIHPTSYQNDILMSFNIAEGRVGEFIIDKNENLISLTALIFGRHHDAFEYAKFVQVYQKHKGEAEILITKIEAGIEINWEDYFDFSNVNITFTFSEISKPKLTKAGKLALLVKEKAGE